ncbi:hypothetical protein [Gimesia sp.]|uniref:hypothetical protein n=1 Tax=Gimesia sp. TaxID=2024833 RepID=UPI003A9061C8
MQVIQTVISNSEGNLLVIAFLAAVICQSMGLVYSRQWFLIPFAIGVAGLTGFLLNPIADSNTLLDLQERVLAPDILLFLCAGQLLLSAASLTSGLRIITSKKHDFWSLVLGIISSVPSPVVVISILFVEQQWLASQIGARPELAGICVGSALILIMIMMCLIGYLFKPNFVLRIHIIGCLTLCILAGLVTTLNQTLPEVKQVQSLWQMFLETGLALLIALIFVSVGFLLGRNQQTRIKQVVATNKSS